MTEGEGASRVQGVDASLAFAVAGVQAQGPAAPRLGYRRAGEGHHEDRRIVGEVLAIDDGVTLRFALPATPVDFILLEPAAIPGCYAIPRLVYGGQDVRDLRRRVIDVRERMGDATPVAGIRFASNRGRPAVELDVRGLAGGGFLELVLRRDADGAAAVAEVLVEMGRHRDADQAAATRLATSLASLGGRIDGLARAVEGVPAMGVEQRSQSARIEALGQRLDTLSEDVSGLVAQGSAAAAALERLSVMQSEMEAGRVAAAEAATRDSVKLQQVLGALEARMEQLQSHADHVQGQVERVRNAVENVFWRRWLRRLRGGRP